MSGVVGVIANDAGRFTMFSVCLTQLRHPVNTSVLWKLSTDRVVGRNAVVRDALEVGAEWVLFLDDDQTFSADLLTQLLSWNVPVVGALYVQRAYPFMPIAYSSKDEETGIWEPLRLPSLPEKGLIEVAGCGTGGMLIRSEVFHRMLEPWFDFRHAASVSSEDLIFCEKVTELGLGPIYVDTGVRMGHLGMAATSPGYDPKHGGWHIGFQLSDGFSLAVGIDQPVEEPVTAPQ